MEQRIRFCRAPDGARIAYAVSGGGSGVPLVRVATWLTHLEKDAVIYHHWLDELGADRRFVRYDLRGCGLSDRDVGDLSLQAKVGDLEAVVDAAGLGRFDLLGLSGGGPVAIAYAVRHPERVAHLVLYGSYARGRGRRPGRTAVQREEEALLVDLTRVGWGRENPAFRRVFTDLFMPDATADEVAAYDEMQRLSSTPAMAARIREASYDTDVSDLARRVSVPTLVMHVRDDAVAPFDEGRRLATLVPGAELVPLTGRNHLLRPEDPAWHTFVEETIAFLDRDEDRGGAEIRALSPREREVLALVAEGLANDAVAERLSLSVRTVERHLSTIYRKLGLSGPSARAAAAAQLARDR